MKLREYFLYAKKKKKNLFNNSSPWHPGAILESITMHAKFAMFAVYGGSMILICVPKKNEGLTGLERHEGE